MKSDAQAEYTKLSNRIVDIARPTQRHNYTITDFFSNYEEVNNYKIVNLPGQKGNEDEESETPKIVQKKG